MNDVQVQKIRKRFRGKESIKSRYVPKIPDSAEREYTRLINDYMKILKLELELKLPKLKDMYKKNRDEEIAKGIRNDSMTDLLFSVSQIFTTIKNKVISKIATFGLKQKLKILAYLNRKLTLKEWKRAIKLTLGIDINEDYYLNGFCEEELGQWIDENVALISTIPEESLDKMRDVVYMCFDKGITTTKLASYIQNIYKISKNHAKLIARDQTAKLNGQIQKAQQLDAGITEYIWTTSKDSRVRKSHSELDGKKFSWSNPPQNSDGRKCHPGEDFQCRCIGRPVFNQNMSLPIDDDSVKVTIT